MRRVVRLLRLLCLPVIAVAALTGGVARALEAQAAAHCARHPADAVRAEAGHGHAAISTAHGAHAAALGSHAATSAPQPADADGECPHCPASACASATVCIGGPAALAASTRRVLAVPTDDDGLHVVAMREPGSPTFTPPTPPPNTLD